MFSCVCEPDINTRGVGRIRDSYANPRRSRRFAELSRILPTPLVFISGYTNPENVFYCLTTNHAITYTNHYNVKLQKSILNILIVVRQKRPANSCRWLTKVIVSCTFSIQSVQMQMANSIPSYFGCMYWCFASNTTMNMQAF